MSERKGDTLGDYVSVKTVYEMFLLHKLYKYKPDKLHKYCKTTGFRATLYPTVLTNKKVSRFVLRKDKEITESTPHVKNEEDVRALFAEKRKLHVFLSWILKTGSQDEELRKFALDYGAQLDREERAAIARAMMPTTNKKAIITQDELDEFYAWIDECADDNVGDEWIPTKEDLSSFVEPRYGELTQKLRNCDSDCEIESLKEQQKLLLLFLLWVQETCSELPKDAFRYITDFVEPKLIIG